MPPTLRRPHKKSRLGCVECKRRRIKCDERRPICSNCSIIGRTCAYASQTPDQIRPSVVPPSPAQTPSQTSTSGQSPADPATSDQLPASSSTTLQLPQSHLPTVNTPKSPGPSAQDGALFPPLNMRHMELFSHFLFDAGPSLDERCSEDSGMVRDIMGPVLSTPYLMHQVLALSAMHLSHTRPDSAQYFREEATALQTQALSLFNDAAAYAGSESCVPMLLFASFLGIHALAEAVSASETDADGFLDRFIDYLNLHRGVYAVNKQSSAILKQSGISSFLDHGRRSLQSTSSQSQERAAMVVGRLVSLLDEADMGTESDAACRDAVSHLRLIYQSDASAEGVVEQQGTSVIWAWPVLLSSTFTDLLMKRRPEALVILCYYAVILHQRRRLWVVGDSGRMLIQTITSFLGTYWKQWLDWPNEMLN